MQNQKIVLILLRLSIASVFIYAAVAATLQPDNWTGYFPVFVTKLLPLNTALLLFSVFQALLSIWILSGWKNFWAALLSAITLLGIIGANTSDLDVLFRDFAIFFAAVALTVSTYSHKSFSKK
ncbi:MAG: hypothetical protein ACREHC_00535 [Candidatus Levyibacteriota bacterium]